MALPASPVFVDVGANIGAFALDVVARWPLARGACYEPGFRAYGALASNIASNDRPGRVRVSRVAIVGWSGSATVDLFEHLSDSCTSTVVPERAPDDASSIGRWVVVPAESLQAVLAQWPGGIDLMKIDVEGAEYDIILGTPVGALSAVRNAVIEYHAVAGHSVDELAERFASAGFVWRRWERSALPGQGLCWWAQPS
jgi:FkbM family methyltransferase